MKTSDSVDRQTTKDGFTKFWDTLEGIEGVHRSNKLERSGEVKERLRVEVKALVGKGYRDAVKKWAGSLGVKCESFEFGAGIGAGWVGGSGNEEGGGEEGRKGGETRRVSRTTAFRFR